MATKKNGNGSNSNAKYNVYATQQELEAAVKARKAEGGKALRCFLVNGAYVMAPSLKAAMWQALKAGVPGLSCTELLTLKADDVVASISFMSDEEREKLRRALK